MTALCPRCGHNLTRDEPIELGDWRIVPNETAHWRSLLVARNGVTVNILLALARMGGRCVTPDALLNRVSDYDDTNLVRVYVSRFRRALPPGVPDPIETVQRRGYRWAGV